MPRDMKLRETIKQRLEALEISAREASRRAGLNVGWVGDFLSARSKSPDAQNVLKLAEALEFDAASFLNEDDLARAKAVIDQADSFGDALPGGQPDHSGPMAGMIPIYAAELPMARQFVPLKPDPVGYLPCWAGFKDNAPMFALRVPSDVNAPRFRAGELIICDSNRSPRVGDFVVVRCAETDDVGIGCAEALRADSLVMRFIALEGEDSTREILYTEVKALSTVVGSLSIM